MEPTDAAVRLSAGATLPTTRSHRSDDAATRWSELPQRLDASLAFARRTVTRADRHHPMWAIDLGQVSGYEKMILEASLFAMITSRRGHNVGEAHALARCIRQQYDSTDAIRLMLRRPATATTLGTTILALDSFGLATDLERQTLGRALASPFTDGSERVPFRLLDREWVKHLAGRSSLAHVDHLVELSAACRVNHPIHMSREDAYAITHTVMYATDFGHLAVPVGLRGPALLGTVDASLAWCLAAGDFDLVAELLMTQLMLARGLTPYGRVAWCVTEHTWDELGFLPSPSLSAETLHEIADDIDREQYAFQQMYHTVFVGGLLVDAMMAGPVLDIGGPSSAAWYALVRGHVAEARTMLRGDADERAWPAWQPADHRADELSAKWRPAVAGRIEDAVVERMAVDAACIEAARSDDLVALVAAVRRASTLPSTSVTDAAALGALAGQCLPSGAIGAAVVGDEVSGWENDGRRLAARSVASSVADLFDVMVDRFEPSGVSGVR